ncbi:MAG: TrmH family RNA methyltransferase, partial [Bacillota bacterium]
MSIEIYGKNTCLEVIKSERKIYSGFIMENTNQDILNYLKRNKLNYQILNKHDFKNKFHGNHQGVVLEVEDYKTYDLKPFLNTLDIKANPLLLMLDQITDVHNLGAIIRSCEAGGVAGIIIPKKRSAKLTATVAKTSSGAIEHVKIV